MRIHDIGALAFVWIYLWGWRRGLFFFGNLWYSVQEWIVEYGD